MGNQHRKSDMATVMRRRATVTSLLLVEVVVVENVDMELAWTDQ
jgi:hypothetical protein